MPDDAPYHFGELDPLIHERSRLGILSLLASRQDGAAFTDLERLCGLTPGNLNRHLSALEAGGLVSIQKTFTGRRPHTTCRITTDGRRRFAGHIAALERVVKDASEASGLRTATN